MTAKSERAAAQELLGTAWPDDWPLRVHVFEPAPGLQRRISYLRLSMDLNAATTLMTAAGLRPVDTDPLAEVIARTGWFLEPADPPGWWTGAPAALLDQAARALTPAGWLVGGWADGQLYLLANEVGPTPHQG